MPIHGYPGNVITANPTAPTVSSASGVWTTEQQLINQSAGRWPMAATQISRSLRFNSADSAYLNRTPASAGNRRTFTMNYWLKRTELGIRQVLASAGTGTNAGHQIEFQSDNTLAIYSLAPGASVTLSTTQVFRDPSAWGMLTFAFDTTQATDTNRIKIYWNGTQITAFSSASYPAQNADLEFNNNVPQLIGRREISTALYCGLYLAEIVWVDGLALTPAYFGFNNSDTGVWTPRQYTGAYGTNGFYLNFSDNSGTTSTTLGKDTSGNGNNWTPNNFSVTAGAGNDSLVDSPTSYGTDTGVGGEVRGNYATLNPLQNGGVTLTNGNLDGTSASGWITTYATIGISTGKWYWEGTCTRSSANEALMGIVKAGATLSSYVGFDANGWCYYTSASSSLKINNASTSAYGAIYTTGDVIGVALDLDAGTLVFYKNGVSQGTAYSSLSGQFFPAISVISNSAWVMNFGQRAFAYTAPSGFKCLVSTNLPTPTIGTTSSTRADDYFVPFIWTGNGAATRSLTGVGFAPDMIWTKNRSTNVSNLIYDIIRGPSTAGASKALITNGLFAEGAANDNSSFGYLSAFDSDGFSVVNGSTPAYTNVSSELFIAWTWKASNSNVTNTNGTITSTIRANTTSGFSIVTYTGAGVNSTVGHGLGVAPSMIILKSRSQTSDWHVYHQSIGAANAIFLNGTNASTPQATAWNSTAPTSTVFSLGTSTNVNSSGSNYVAYCFAPISGFSAMGSYTGNGLADGPFVFVNHRPAFLLIKRTDTTSNWTLLDSQREGYNADNDQLFPNSASLETTTDLLDLLSNGFKLRATDASVNASGGTYVYISLASNPFKYSRAR